MLRSTALAAALCAGAAQAEGLTIRAAVLEVARDRPLPISRLDVPAEDEGFAGARLSTKDNNTTGSFLKQIYETAEAKVGPADAVAAFDALVEGGVRFVLVIASADDLLALADHAAGLDEPVLLFNLAALDDRLRGEDCRANVMHVTPSRAMLADGLAQYLVWKQWTDWALIHGSHPEDLEQAEAFRAAAEKFGAEIVEERVYEDTGGARRADSGHVQVQRQIPVFTQEMEEHDIVVAADRSEVFAVYLPFRTWSPRPVAGDAGLRPRAWHPAHEGFGATQLQRRFEAEAGRTMSDLDYEAWAALRALGEAVTRTGSAEPEAVKDYLLSPDFALGAFKGVPLSFRPWDQQLRQAILVADDRLVVSVSPQDQFLHQRTQLDTLGVDEPESDCRL